MDITRYIEQNREVGRLIDRSDDPIEALSRINPEIAALVHADAELGGLSPEVTALSQTFRVMQRDEKVAALQSLVEIYSIDSNERMHGSSLQTEENIARIGFETNRYHIDADERKHKGTLKTATELKEIERKMFELGIGVELERVASDERKHNRSLETTVQLGEIEERMVKLGIGLELEKTASDERKHSRSVNADVYKHQLSITAEVEESREETKRTELQERGLLGRTLILKDIADRDCEKEEYLADSEERRTKYGIDANERIAIRVTDVEARMAELGIDVERERIYSSERKYMGSLQASTESDQRIQETLERAISDQQFIIIMKLFAAERERRDRLDHQEVISAYQALVQCSEMV